MRTSRPVSSFFLACVLVFLTATSLDAYDKVRVLIVDGQNNHDWQMTTRSIRSTLIQSGHFLVDVSQAPPKSASEADWENWQPAFSSYDVVLSNFNNRRKSWPGRIQKSFEAFVGGGGGAVIVHAANNSFPEWVEYNKMIGLGYRRPDFGLRLTIDDPTGESITKPAGEGKGSGHGRQHAYVVKVRDSNHPIMRGLPPLWLHAKDELYHGQRGPAENMTILSSAYSDPETGGTGAHEPITWWIPHGKGKVVTTVLGHHWKKQEDFDALHCVGFQTIVARATEWAATGRVTIPIPPSFPTAEATSIVAPEKLVWSAPKPPVALKFKAGSCCDTAFKEGKNCAHPCCAKKIAQQMVCRKCNPD